MGHSRKLPNRAGPQQGTIAPVDDQQCPQPSRQHTNAHPRGWPPGALMGGQGDTQRRRDSIPPPPSTRSWSLNPIRQVLDTTLGLCSEAEERQGRMEEGPQRGEGSTLPADGQDGPVGRLQGSGTSRRAGRVPPSCPQEPTSPLSQGTLTCNVESTFLTQSPTLTHQPGHLSLYCPSLNPISQHLL